MAERSELEAELERQLSKIDAQPILWGPIRSPRIYESEIRRAAALDDVIRGYTTEEAKQLMDKNPLVRIRGKGKRGSEFQWLDAGNTVPSFLRGWFYKGFRIDYRVFCEGDVDAAIKNRKFGEDIDVGKHLPLFTYDVSFECEWMDSMGLARRNIAKIWGKEEGERRVKEAIAALELPSREEYDGDMGWDLEKKYNPAKIVSAMINLIS